MKENIAFRKAVGISAPAREMAGRGVVVISGTRYRLLLQCSFFHLGCRSTISLYFPFFSLPKRRPRIHSLFFPSWVCVCVCVCVCARAPPPVRHTAASSATLKRSVCASCVWSPSVCVRLCLCRGWLVAGKTRPDASSSKARPPSP